MTNEKEHNGNEKLNTLTDKDKAKNLAAAKAEAAARAKELAKQRLLEKQQQLEPNNNKKTLVGESTENHEIEVKDLEEQKNETQTVENNDSLLSQEVETVQKDLTEATLKSGVEEMTASEVKSESSEETPVDDDAKAKAIAAAKAKAAAAAKAKAAALAKAKSESSEETPVDDDAKAKAIAAAKAKAAAAAKAKAAAQAKVSSGASTNDGDDAKAKAIAAAKAKAAALAKAKKEPESVDEEKKVSKNDVYINRYIEILGTKYGKEVVLKGYINFLSKEVPTIELSLPQYYEVMQTLRDDPNCLFDSLNELHATHFGDELEVYVHLFSYARKQNLAVKVRCLVEHPHVPSVTPIWEGANWPEREAYDLLGVHFTNHPNLTRILLSDDWIGYPLRKDYEQYDGEV